jgi:cytochrome c oxidase subunit 2
VKILIAALLVVSFASDAWPAGEPKVISVKAKKFEYNPKEIHLKKGEPVVLEFTTEDRKHGFKVPELNLAAVIKPGETTRVPVTPDKVGRFEFHCSVFCGSGHEGMTGVIVVE